MFLLFSFLSVQQDTGTGTEECTSPKNRRQTRHIDSAGTTRIWCRLVISGMCAAPFRTVCVESHVTHQQSIGSSPRALQGIDSVWQRHARRSTSYNLQVGLCHASCGNRGSVWCSPRALEMDETSRHPGAHAWATHGKVSHGCQHDP